MRFWRRGREADLLEREFLVATLDANLEIGEQVLDQGTGFDVRSTTATDGTAVLPVFTSEGRLLEWMPEGSHFLGLSGRDLLSLFVSNNDWEAVVIDPTGSNTAIFRPEAQRLLSTQEL